MKAVYRDQEIINFTIIKILLKVAMKIKGGILQVLNKMKKVFIRPMIN